MIAGPILGAMMIFDRQRLPFVLSLGGRHASSCMQFPAASIGLKAIASLLAIWAAGAWAGTPGSAAALAPTCSDLASCDAAAAEPDTFAELSQDVLRASSPAALTATEASGPTIAQPKRTLSFDKLGDVKARAVGLASWESAAAGTAHRPLASCTLIVLHIRLQV